MYGQQFVHNQMFGQPNMMPYQPGVLPPQMTSSVPTGSLPANYNASSQQPQNMPVSVSPNMNNEFGNNCQGGQMQGRGPQRPRNNGVGAVSRVLHLRNVTPEVTQLSIQNLALNFGNVKHIVMLRQMNQALVEMATLKSAQVMVDSFREPGYAEVDGRRVYIRYSNHQELTATQHSSRTLLVSMFNTQYDVSSAAHITPEIVYQIFANYGAVQKIVVLPKNDSSHLHHNRVQALAQFDTRETAENVKNILQGQPVTLGDSVNFTLDIQFSRMDEIKTTNPLTSLLVDESGATYRPQGQGFPLPYTATQTIQSNGVYAAVPQQWS